MTAMLFLAICISHLGRFSNFPPFDHQISSDASIFLKGFEKPSSREMKISVFTIYKCHRAISALKRLLQFLISRNRSNDLLTVHQWGLDDKMIFEDIPAHFLSGQTC